MAPDESDFDITVDDYHIGIVLVIVDPLGIDQEFWMSVTFLCHGSSWLPTCGSFGFYTVRNESEANCMGTVGEGQPEG